MRQTHVGGDAQESARGPDCKESVCILNRPHFNEPQYLKALVLLRMNQVRVHVHIECHDGRETDGVAEYVKTLTANMRSDVSRKVLLRKVCSWIETEQLFHEHSALVAASVRCALGQGIMQPVPAHTYLAVSGCENPQMRLAVQHELLHENVHLAVGRLNISTATEPGSAGLPAYTFLQSRSSLLTNVPVVQLACVHDNLTFELSLRMFPRNTDTAFSQCFEQVADECRMRLEHTQLASTQLASAPRAPQTPLARAPLAQQTAPASAPAKSRTLSHRSYRVACQATHRRNLLAMGLEQHAVVFAEHQVFDRTTSMLSSTLETRGRPHTVHTVFFH